MTVPEGGSKETSDVSDRQKEEKMNTANSNYSDDNGGRQMSLSSDEVRSRLIDSGEHLGEIGASSDLQLISDDATRTIVVGIDIDGQVAGLIPHFDLTALGGAFIGVDGNRCRSVVVHQFDLSSGTLTSRPDEHLGTDVQIVHHPCVPIEISCPAISGTAARSRSVNTISCGGCASLCGRTIDPEYGARARCRWARCALSSYRSHWPRSSTQQQVLSVRHSRPAFPRSRLYRYRTQ